MSYVLKLSDKYEPLSLYLNTSCAINQNNDLKLKPDRVNNACRIGNPYKGFFWKYANDEDLIRFFKNWKFIDIA